MSRRTQVIVGFIALLMAAGSGLLLYANFSRMVTTARVVTPARAIPAGALIEEQFLVTREVPRPLLDEDIFVRREDLVGKVAVVPLRPGMVVYRSFAVPLKEYRLVDDPAFSVVSFPVDPARAVGGQIQPGHRVDIWQLAASPPTSGDNLVEVMGNGWATATVLARNVLVVDVRSSAGQAVARSPQAVPGQVSSSSPPAPASGGTLQILTVAVPPDVAREILALVAKQQTRSSVVIWVSLSPMQ